MEIEEFVAKFHKLTGETAGDKHKNFNLLLKDIPQDHDKLIASLAPKNLLESHFKLKILLSLQIFPELIHILKSENEHISFKLLKNRWFCRKLASVLNESSSDFVSGVLPFTSYVIRRRIIENLALYGRSLDAVYDEVCARYGIYIGTNLLPGCSPTKIENVLKNGKVALSPHHQKLLYQKHPQLFHLYMKQNRDVDESVMTYIARHDTTQFLELLKEFQLYRGSLGKRLTKKLLKKDKEELITEAGTFCVFLHLRTLIKGLGKDDLKRFVLNCSPSRTEDLSYGSMSYYNLCKKLGKCYYGLLLEIMEKKFKKSVYDFPDLVSEDMMEMLDVEERQKWIAIKQKNGVSKNDLIRFMKVEDAIPLVKEKINVKSSIDEREKLIQILLETCKVNHDLTALAEVCEYVSFRHRNDENVLVNFLYQLPNQFKLDVLEERHWESINSLIRHGYYLSSKYEFSVKYLEFLFRRKKLTDEQISDFLKLSKQSNQLTYRIDDQELRKILLLKSIDLLPTFLEEEKLEYEDLKLMSYMCQWNSDHPTDQIAIWEYPRLNESFKKCLKIAREAGEDDHIEELYKLSSVLEAVICIQQKSDFREQIINDYLQVKSRWAQQKIDIWLLKHEPNTILPQFLEHIFNAYSKSDLVFLNYLKKYTDPSFQEKVTSHCLEMVNKNENVNKVFHILAVLEPVGKFLEHIAPFYPTEAKIGESDPESRRKWEISVSIAESFRYTSSSSVLPTLIKYCKGDFLRFALESLYYLFDHSPENQLSVFINDLSSKAVSVRKHSIFLTCKVGTVEDVQRLLNRFIENERNVSVLKHLFTASLKYFIKNPSDDFWECVKTCMTKLDRNDGESFNMLVNLNQIPDSYKARHVIFVWEILKKNELDENRPRLLSVIPSSLFRDFPLEFLLEIIEENFLKSGSACETAINNFVVASLTQSQKKEIIDTIFRILNQVKSNKCDLKQEKKTRCQLFSFVNELVRTATFEEHDEILRTFSQRWHSLFTPVEFMREHLQLSFTLLYLESKKDLKQFSSVVAEFLENLVSSYGVVIVDCFASELKDSLESFLCCYGERNEDFFKFCLNLVKNWNNLVFYLLVMKLLPTKEPSQDNSKELFQQIVQTLREVPQESIQILMNLYVSDMD